MNTQYSPFDRKEEIVLSREDVEKLSSRQMYLDIALSYARDIVSSWDTVSFRTLRSLHDKVMGLKEALEMLK